jgi:tRNA G18 (ribose-2'-O)-methylase SpoU
VAELVPISDPDDPRIAAYVRLRDRDIARQHGFIAEGDVVVDLLVSLRSRCETVSMLIARRRLQRLEPLIRRLPPTTPVFVAEQPAMDRVVGFHIHRGVLAHGRRPPNPPAEALLAALPARALVVAALGVSNHDNIGGLFRNAAAFGADAVVIDSACCDPLYRKAIRVSAGGTLKVPWSRIEAGDDPLALLEGAGFAALALAPRGAEPLSAIACAPRAALLVGAEGAGLPASVLRRARTVRIPMAAGWDSLNVAAASAVALNALAQGRGDV